MEAIAYLSCEQVDAYYFHEYYLVLNSYGDLFKMTEKSKVYGTTYGWNRSAELLADSGLTIISGGASMTMLDENLALIAVNGEDEVVLYTYDLEAEELTMLGVLDGVAKLIGLTMPMEKEVEEEAQAANKVTGSTMTVVATNSETSEETEGEDITIADGNVTVNLRKDGTNGKLIITFDPTVLTYKGMSSASVFCSINEAEAAEGKLILVYAAAQAISAEEIPATLNFEVVNPVTSTITVEQAEDGDAASEEKDELAVEFEEVYTMKWVSVSTTLSGNIGLNFYADLSANLVNNPDTFVRFIFAGRTIDVPMAGATVAVNNGTTLYRFTCPITSKNMTDVVSAQVMVGEGLVGNAKTMDVATYCNWVIENYAHDAKTVNLMKAMLNYGVSAQMLFEYRTDDLANAALSEADKVLGKVDASAYAHSKVGREEGITPLSYTLLLDSETTIRCYFELTGSKSIDEFTFTVDGMEVKPKEKDGFYYIEKTNIAAHRLDDMHVFTCGGITITYGGLSYVNQVMGFYTEGATFDMASALYAYSKAAEAYIG